MIHVRPILALLPFVCVLPAQAQIVERLDVSSAGVGGDVAADRVVISDDGQVVAFLSRASNILLPDDAVSVDVYVRDRATSTTVRLASNVGQTDRLEISGNGRWIVYGRAQAGAPTPTHTTFLHDHVLVTTVQLAPSIGDTLPGAITPDGQWMVLFGRPATLPLGAFSGYRLDLQINVPQLVARNQQGMAARVRADRGAITADGDGLVFTSLDTDIVPGADLNGENDVFLFRVAAATVERVSVDDLGVLGDRESFQPSMTADGSLVAFTSNSTNFDPSASPPFPGFNVYVRDLSQGTTRRISTPAAGGFLNGTAQNPLISAQGRVVAFDSNASSIVAGHGGASFEVFVRDLAGEVVRTATPGVTGPGQDSNVQSVSADGRFLAIRSANTSLPGASATGGAYLADMGPGCSAQSYCTALPNSTGVAASIGAQGEASRVLNNFTLSVVNLPPNAIALFASGSSAVDPGVPFGNGLRCIGGSLLRHGILHASGGVVIDFQDVGSARYVGVLPGTVRYFQCIYRDPAAGSAAFNTSDALAVTFCF